ncbi:MAG: tRNA (adenosine(37)-N6)-threonylcarbamoyltransferase complex ATPase subunit type 1 TsaE [Candidatus Zixiibacteriota bacterium]
MDVQKILEFKTTSPELTMKAGEKLVAVLNSGDVIALSGPLGAGKTCLIKGIAAGLGVEETEVKSPSYTLVNEYFGSMPLYHFDLYRLKDESELYNIGWDEYLMRDGIMVVEWGEKAGEQLPQNRVQIDIIILGEEERTIKIEFKG